MDDERASGPAEARAETSRWAGRGASENGGVTSPAAGAVRPGRPAAALAGVRGRRCAASARSRGRFEGPGPRSTPMARGSNRPSTQAIAARVCDATPAALALARARTAARSDIGGRRLMRGWMSRPAQSGQDGRRLDARADPKRETGARQMFVHCARRKAEPFPDSRRRQAGGRQGEALPLAIAQRTRGL